MANNGGRAFPFAAEYGHPAACGGRSLRDYFAGLAMQGMLAHSARYRPRKLDSHLHWHEALAKEAHEIADAMPAAREGENGKPMTELPQWAVEEADALAAVAMETLLSMSDKTVEDRGIWLAGFIARALADAMLAAREEGA